MPFSPFDDTQNKPRGPRPTRNGYNTSGWDQYRQGVEIINDRFRFLGTQPKMWSGNTDGSVSVVTYGQPRGAIEENPIGLESKFLDLPRFDPVAYISMGVAYPVPIQFNEGPLQQNEAVLEPLAIPFRKHSNEGPFFAHAIRGELEDGNNFDSYVTRNTNRIEQFVDFAAPKTPRFFLDEGGDTFGGIRRDPFAADIERKFTPFDDTLPYSPEKRLQTSNSTIKDLVAASARIGDGLLPYGKKSVPAGWSYYGLNAGQYGTDSIVFGGWARGS